MNSTKIKKLPFFKLHIGTDPEFFLKKAGKIVGSEKYIPEDGLRGNASGYSAKVIVDGVQAELNPVGSFCRELLANQIGSGFLALREHFKATKLKAKVVCSQTVEISKKEMDSLSDKSKQLGCTPSLNIYDADASVGVADPSRLFKRSAGGHIHLGCLNGVPVKEADDIFKKIYREQPERVVQMLDIVCGNTCVLLDRDNSNRERRQYYGRAGEYRLPNHGLEYRTLSNFWLNSYTLMSLATSLARLAVLIVYDTEKNKNTVERQILDAVTQYDIIKAINENDFDIAKANFDKIKNILAQACDPEEIEVMDSWTRTTVKRKKYTYQDPPFTTETLTAIDKFIETVNKKGLKHYFGQDMKDPIKHWIGRVGVGRGNREFMGWESFVKNKLLVKKIDKKVGISLTQGV